MFFAVRAGAPRRTVLTGSSTSTFGRLDGLGGSAGTAPRLPGALGRASLVCIGRSTVAVRPLLPDSPLGPLPAARVVC